MFEYVQKDCQCRMQRCKTEAAAGCAALPVEEMAERASEAAAFLKALSHEGRLMILCHLSAGEKTVTELEARLARGKLLSASNWRGCALKGWWRRET